MGMERADQIMEKMGFRKDASEAVKIAFIKGLIKQTYGVDVRTPLHLTKPDKPAALASAEQMSFDFEKVG